MIEDKRRGPLVTLEGTWDELESHASEFRGRRLRLVVLDEAVPGTADRLARLARATGRLVGPAIPAEALRRERLYDEFE